MQSLAKSLKDEKSGLPLPRRGDAPSDTLEGIIPIKRKGARIVKHFRYGGDPEPEIIILNGTQGGRFSKQPHLIQHRAPNDRGGCNDEVFMQQGIKRVFPGPNLRREVALVASLAIPLNHERIR